MIYVLSKITKNIKTIHLKITIFTAVKKRSILHRYVVVMWTTHEPHHEKTNVLHIYENKDADQLHGNREADQRLCFRYIDSTIPLLSKYEISSL